MLILKFLEGTSVHHSRRLISSPGSRFLLVLVFRIGDKTFVETPSREYGFHKILINKLKLHDYMFANKIKILILNK